MGPQTTAPPGAEGPVMGDKRKVAPSSPTGVRPSPSALPRFTQSSQPLAHLALLRPPPPRPATPGKWMLVRNTHWLRDDGLPEVRAWMDLLDGEILSLFSPRQQREMGEATQLQRLLMAAPMPSDRNNWSFAQNQIQQAVLAWSTSTNHLATWGENRLGSVLMGANQVFNPVDLTAQMFFNQLQRINTAREHAQGQGTRLVPALTRPYAQCLARLGAAMDGWQARVVTESALPVEGCCWDNVSEHETGQRFRPRSALNFHIVDIRLFLSGLIVFWAMPVGPLAATVDEVNVNLKWIPEEMREVFMAGYLARVVQLEEH
ncbi:hypothetical protein BDV93DRAFT_515731 [Ceratobasidium sp. AG-I]|nr:hypothetical protein BDV93DRAFT_515731 [Ceratobasidium sp. AG-I]